MSVDIGPSLSTKGRKGGRNSLSLSVFEDDDSEEEVDTSNSLDDAKALSTFSGFDKQCYRKRKNSERKSTDPKKRKTGTRSSARLRGDGAETPTGTTEDGESQPAETGVEQNNDGSGVEDADGGQE